MDCESVKPGVKLTNYYVAHLKGESQALLVQPDIISPADLEGKTIGTPFGSTAHFYSTYIPVVSGVEFKLARRSCESKNSTNAGGQSLRSRPSRRLSFAGVAEPGDGFDDGRRLAETRTQKHRRANLPRRTSAFSSRHDDNV